MTQPFHRILIVDDDPDICTTLGDLLEHEGYVVQVVATGAEALAKTRQHRYSAALLDIGLPDIDGLSVLPRIQQMDPKLPVIILTAFTTEEKTIGALSHGAFAYLTKPYNRDELKATVQRAIGVKSLAIKAEHAEIALTESEERFRTLVESATDAIVLADQDGMIMSWNQAAQGMFQYAESEVLGRSLTMIMPLRYQDAHRRGLNRMRLTGESRVIGRTVELFGLRKDGTEFPLELSLASWTTKEERFFSGIIRDITTRKSVENALSRLQRHHELVLSSAGEGIYGLDREGRTTFVNPAAARLLGWEVPDLLGSPTHSVLHHSRADGSPYPLEDCPIHRAMAEGRVFVVDEDVFWRKDGTCFAVEYVTTPIREDNQTIGAVITFKDISERKRTEAALRFSEERFRTLVTNLPGTVYRCACDPDWTMEFLSESIRDLTGYPASDFLGNRVRSYASVIHPDDREQVEHTVQACVQQYQPYELTYRLLHADQSIRWVYEKGQGVFGDDGQVRYLEGVIFDHTARKSMEDALLQSEERLRMALAGGGMGTWDWWIRTGTVLWSDTAAIIFGFPLSERESSYPAFLKVLHPDDRPAVLEDIRKSLDGHVDLAITHRIIRPDGVIRWVSSKGSVLRDAEGEPLRIVAVVQDITGPRLAAQALEESRELFRQFAENIKDVFWMTDPEKNTMLYISPAYEEIWGRSCVSLYAEPRSWLDAIHPDDRERVFTAALTTQRGGTYAEQYRIIRPDGSIRWIFDRAFPIKDRSGTVYRIAGIAEDITERRPPP